ncbi:DinB family protein [Flavobacterium sp. MFBS3-15]|uniref:DinB family protein n=1 Tax=Flavobacterium sp. MFBS3-15 TaxID=2989816 RepID=UPI002236A238|nr:DinB family protein [Flavobacterium sp. MFBS3-15]MCW4469301.1 DinB family protein [Flavobacterium sp. MFBS3-15]
MEHQFRITRVSREIYDRYFDTYSLEQLNRIPPGFSNNLIWNIGHIIVSQQLLVYGGAGEQLHVSDELVSKYMRGTKPEYDLSQKEADEIRALLFTPVERTEQDYYNKLFKTFTERTTQLGFTLSSVEDAISFNNYHEGIHLGIMMSIRKFL